LSFDLEASLGRLEPQKRVSALSRRPDAPLDFADIVSAAGPELLLDSCVTIDLIQDRAPAELDSLLEARVANHSTVVLAQLTHLFGRLDPAHPKTPATLKVLRAAIAAIPGHRLACPSIRASGEAGILGGLVARLTGRETNQALLNDALIHCQAVENGHSVLTANLAEFDLFDQIIPGSTTFYRT
jgi:predicted nucleic acid-binding protein